MISEDYCHHDRWEILQPWEYIRKYRCVQCGAVAMCACDEEWGIKLPHQLTSTRPVADPTQRVAVTHGFLPRVCPTCRGDRELPFPKADGYGSPSRIDRYYWREIAKEAFLLEPGMEFPSQACWNAARERAKELHAAAPRYDIEAHDRGCPPEIPTMEIQAEHVLDDNGVGRWMTSNGPVRAEDLVAQHLEHRDWAVRSCERRVPAALFATLMGPFVLNERESKATPMCFGRRDGSGALVSLDLPLDHHQSAWFRRRERDIREYLATMKDPAAVLQDNWQQFWPYREYLWAGGDDIRTSTEWIVDHLSDRIPAIILYLARDYWSHCTGWPDLIALRSSQVRFIEVKTPNDRLSEDQIRWFTDNGTHLHLDAHIARVRRHH